MAKRYSDRFNTTSRIRTVPGQTPTRREERFQFSDGSVNYDPNVTETQFDSGETVRVSRGSGHSQHVWESDAEFEGRKQAERDAYENQVTQAFSIERQLLEEQLLKDHPDGMGMVESHDKYLQGRIEQAIAGAPDDQTRMRVAENLGNLYVASSKDIAQTQQKVVKRGLENSLYISQNSMADSVRNDPQSLEVNRLQSINYTTHLGQKLGWQPEKIQTALEEFDRRLIKESFLGQFDKDPEQAAVDIQKYSNVLSEKEIDSLTTTAARISAFRSEIGQAPSIGELIKRSKVLMTTNEDPDELLGRKAITRTEYEVLKRERGAEDGRLRDPNYANNKEMLHQTETDLMNPEDKAYRLMRMQQLFDGKQLNEQSIDKINQETDVRIKKRINTELGLSKYVAPDVTKLTTDKITGAKKQIAEDVRNGKVSRSEALKQLRILNNANKAL